MAEEVHFWHCETKLDALKKGMSSLGMEVSIFQRSVQMSPPCSWDPPLFTQVELHPVPGRDFCQQTPGISLLGLFSPGITSREHAFTAFFPLPVADITNQSPSSHHLLLRAHLCLTCYAGLSQPTSIPSTPCTFAATRSPRDWISFVIQVSAQRLLSQRFLLTPPTPRSNIQLLSLIYLL